MPNDPRSFMTPRFILGICLAIAGVLLALDRLMILDAGPILRLWPLILIAIGIVILTRPERSGGGASSRINGIALLIFGAWLLSYRIGFLQIRFWEFFWPLVLVLLGAKLVMQTVTRDGVVSNTETASLFAIMGSSKRRWGNVPFRGGELMSIMGGCELDLRDAVLAPGEQATLDVFSLMGGFELRVPEGWAVSSRITPLMGGVVDETRRGAVMGNVASVDGVPPPCLVLRGLIIMSGIEIKN